MANDIEIIQKGSVTVVEPHKNYNRDLGENPLAISIRVKRAKNSKGTPYNQVSGLKHIEYIKDGVSQGKHNLYLRVHFTKDCFKEVGEGCKVHSDDDLSTGVLWVKAKYVQSPRKYEIVEAKDENGNTLYNDNGTAKLKYPEIWIKGGILGFEPYVSTQEEFDYVPSVPSAEEVPDYDPETGVVKDETEDTEDTNM